MATKTGKARAKLEGPQTLKAERIQSLLRETPGWKGKDRRR